MNSYIIDDTPGLIREAEVLSLRFITARYALTQNSCQNCADVKGATGTITLSSLRLIEIARKLESRRIITRQEFEDMINIHCITFLGRNKS